NISGAGSRARRTCSVDSDPLLGGEASSAKLIFQTVRHFSVTIIEWVSGWFQRQRPKPGASTDLPSTRLAARRYREQFSSFSLGYEASKSTSTCLELVRSS